jgi:hypothetical protein
MRENKNICSRCNKLIDHETKKPWCKSCIREYQKEYMRKKRDDRNPNRKKRCPKGTRSPLCARCKKIKEKEYSAYCIECMRFKSRQFERTGRKRPENYYENYVKVASREWRRKHADTVNARVAEDRKNNPEKYLQYDRKWRKENIERDRYMDVLNKHKITSEDYEKLIYDHNNLCAICGKEETKKSRTKGDVCRLAIDHCHKTGKIRGLLCHNCNAGIGHFRDDEELILKAAYYINRNKNTEP